jgi:putative ABC transport system substrate-binding protein
MRRREFISLIGGVAAWPRAARGQQPEGMRRLGILSAFAENDPQGQIWITAFVQGLRELGWTDGGNIRIEYRWGGADAGRIRTAAVELVDLKPDAILAQTALALAPLRELTTSIPVVFMGIGDPVGSGFVASLARPGGNITGFAAPEFAIGAKLLEVLKKVAPQVSRVRVIYNPVQVPQVGWLASMQTAAPSLGVQVSGASAGNTDEITHIIEGFGNEPGGGMVVVPNPITIHNRGLIIALMARHHLPTVYAFSFFVREGGLVSYGSDPTAAYRQAASYIDQILKGAKPTDLPVHAPTKYELAINLKTAKTLGLTIPSSVLATADEVIE